MEEINRPEKRNNQNHASINANTQIDVSFLVNLAYMYLNISDNHLSSYYNQLFTYASHLAKADNPDSVAALALCFAEGLGVNKNIDIALILYNEAASRNSLLAYKHLANIYDKGKYIAADKAKASKFFLKAANAGDAESQYIMAERYRKGIGVDASPESAFSFYLTAAENGIGVAMYRVAQCYENGLGIDINKDSAAQWYCKAANYGIEEAVIKHAQFLYDRGLKDKAVEWLESAANNGNQSAMEALVDHYSEADTERALQMAEALSMQGNNKPLHRLCISVMNKSPEAGKILLPSCQILAKSGDTEAQLCLADYYRAGKHKRHARDWYLAASRNGSSEAMLNLYELYYEHGDMNEAKKWLKLASDNGSQTARTLFYNMQAEAASSSRELERNPSCLQNASYNDARYEAIEHYYESANFSDCTALNNKEASASHIADTNNSSESCPCSNDVSIAYEASVEKSGAYSYDDEHMKTTDGHDMDKILYSIYKNVVELKDVVNSGFSHSSKLISQSEDTIINNSNQVALSVTESLKQDSALTRKLIHTESVQTRMALDSAVSRVENAIQKSSTSILFFMNGKIQKYISDIQDMLLYMELQPDMCAEEFDEVADRYCVYMNEYMNHLLLPAFEEEAFDTVRTTENFLSERFGCIWNRISAAAQKQLVSAYILWNSCKDMNDFDFSGVCIAICAALECELRQVFFKGYQEYMLKVHKYLPRDDSAFDTWPEILLSTTNYMYKKNMDKFRKGLIKDMPIVELREERGFSFGTLQYLLGTKVGRHTTCSQSQLQLNCINDYLASLKSTASAKQIADSTFFEKYMSVYNERNPIAHGKGAKKENARRLFELIFCDGLYMDESVFRYLFDII